MPLPHMQAIFPICIHPAIQNPKINPTFTIFQRHLLPLFSVAGVEGLFFPPLNANLRPIFPKQTQEQKSTLTIQIPPSIISLLTRAGCNNCAAFTEEFRFRRENAAGEGIASGFETRRSAAPVVPTAVLRMKPGIERSMRYHKTGLTRARVREACIVDAQGSLRYFC